MAAAQQQDDLDSLLQAPQIASHGDLAAAAQGPTTPTTLPGYIRIIRVLPHCFRAELRPSSKLAYECIFLTLPKSPLLQLAQKARTHTRCLFAQARVAQNAPGSLHHNWPLSHTRHTLPSKHSYLKAWSQCCRSRQRPNLYLLQMRCPSQHPWRQSLVHYCTSYPGTLAPDLNSHIAHYLPSTNKCRSQLAAATCIMQFVFHQRWPVVLECR